MKTIFKFTLATALLFIGMTSEAQRLKWAIGAGGTGTDRNLCIIVDTLKRTHIGIQNQTGTTTSINGGCTATGGTGSNDAVYGAIDSNGNCITCSYFSKDNDEIQGMYIDAAQNKYLTGYVNNTTEICSLGSASRPQTFVATYSAAGSCNWAHRLDGSANYGMDIKADAQGNTYVIGYFQNTITIGSNTYTASGASDAYVVKYNSSGTEQWVKQIGGSSTDMGLGVSDIVNGVLYVTGQFNGTMVIGSDTLVSSGGGDIYIAKLDSAGNYLWARKAGASGLDIGVIAMQDKWGNVFVSGITDSAAVFGSLTASRTGEFCARYDASGNVQWLKMLGRVNGLKCRQQMVVVDSAIYYIGSFDVYTTIGSYSMNVAGGEDIYVTRLDYSGKALWLKNYGSTSTDRPMGLAVDRSGDAYVTGVITGTVIFDGDTVVSSGSKDAYVFKLARIYPITSAPATVCKGDTFYVTFKSEVNASSGNVFRVQLSDSTGSFATVDTIGSKTDTIAGSIACVIGNDIPAASHYRIRVVSSNPALVGEEWARDVRVGDIPSVPTAPASQTVCSDTVYTFTWDSVVAGSGGNQIEWSWVSNFDTSVIISSDGSIAWQVANGETDTLWLRSKNSAPGCVSESVAVTGRVNGLPEASVSPSDTTVYAGQPVVLTANGGESYYWIESGDTSTAVMITPFHSENMYRLLVTDSLSCNKIVTALVGVKELMDSVSKADLYFEENVGQFDSSVLFRTKVNGTHVRFLSNTVNFYRTSGEVGEEDTITAVVWNLNFEGANGTEELSKHYRKPWKLNYYLGNDTTNWFEDVPVYAGISYNNVYDSINMRFYTSEADGNLKYDVELLPGADIEDIRLVYGGITGLSIAPSGDLQVGTLFGTYLEKRPYSYQIIDNADVPVDVSYQIINDSTFTFTVLSEYDSMLPLIIDPLTVVWSTYTGTVTGTSAFYTHTMDVDGSGITYGGDVWELDFSVPLVSGTYILPTNELTDPLAFVSKIKGDGTDLLYWTVFGGIAKESVTSLKLNGAGKVYGVGHCNSTDFPVIPATNVNLMGSNMDLFVVSIDNTSGVIQYLNKIGGDGEDLARGMDIDGNGSVVVSGNTDSDNFLTFSGTIDPANDEVFVLKVDPLNPGVNGFTSLSVYGGNTGSNNVYDLVANPTNNDIYVLGGTSENVLPSQVQSGGTDVTNGFILKIPSSGSPSSILLGGDEVDRVMRGKISNNRLYFIGETLSDNLLTYYTNNTPIRSTFTSFGNTDGFIGYVDLGSFSSGVAQLSYCDFNSIDYVAPLNTSNHAYGGIDIDGNGDVVVLGLNFNYNINPAPDDCGVGFLNGGLRMMKTNGSLTNLISSFTLSGQYNPTKPIVYNNDVYYAQTAHYQSYTTTGAYISNHPNPISPLTNNASDATTIAMIRDEAISYVLDAGPNRVICLPGQTSVQIGGAPTYNSAFSTLYVEWTSNIADPSLASQTNDANPVVSPAVTTTYTVTLYGSNDGTNFCELGTDDVTVEVRTSPTAAITITPGQVCEDLALSTTGGGTYLWSTSATTSNITVSTAGTYSVTVTNNGCSASASVSVAAPATYCCQGDVYNSHPLTFNNIAISTFEGLIQSYGATINTGVGGAWGHTYHQLSGFTDKIAFNGTLYIDRNFQFNLCNNITFGPNARVIVMPNISFDIVESELKACGNNMWFGIQLSENTSRVSIDRLSVVRDAYYAIYNTTGGWINVVNSTLADNLYHIVIYTNPSGCNITDNIFTSSNSLLPPYTGRRTFTSILIEEVSNNIIIGNYDDSYGRNDFSNFDYGIMGLNSRFEVMNNYFHDYNPTGIADWRVGTGIFIDRTNANNFVVIGDGDTDYSNEFENGKYGVLITRPSNVTVTNNSFSFLRTGIHALNVNFKNWVARSLNINHNNMIETHRGIDVLNAPRTFVDINTNDVRLANSYYDTSPGTNTMGIGVNNVLSSVTDMGPWVSVYGNQVENYLAGVEVGNSPRSYIGFNEVYPTQVAAAEHDRKYGIKVINSPYSEVGDNTVECEPEFPEMGNPLSFGIYAVNSNKVRYCTNTLKGNEENFCGFGNNLGTRLVQNDFHYGLYGVTLRSTNGTIGEQGVPKVGSTPGVDYYNQWWLYYNGSPYTNYHLFSMSPAGETTIFNVHDYTNLLFTMKTKPNLQLLPVLPDEAIGVVSFSEEDLSVADCNTLKNSNWMFKALEPTDTIDYNKDSIIDGDDVFVKDLVEFYNRRAVYESLRVDTADTTFVAQYVLDWADSIDNEDEGRLLRMKKLYEEGIAEGDSAKLVQAGLVADSVSNYPAPKQYIKFIYSAYASSVSGDTIAVAERDYGQIAEIADMCLFEGGEAVYMARTLMRLMDTTERVYEDECSTGGMRMLRESNKKEVKPSPLLKAYPNPSTGSFIITYRGNIEFSKLEIVNSVGQPVWVGNLTENFGSVVFSAYNYSPGIYFVRWTDNEGNYIANTSVVIAK